MQALLRFHGLREKMPAIALSEGIWLGRYRHLNEEGDVIDEHRGRSVCRMLTH